MCVCIIKEATLFKPPLRCYLLSRRICEGIILVGVGLRLGSALFSSGTFLLYLSSGGLKLSKCVKFDCRKTALNTYRSKAKYILWRKKQINYKFISTSLFRGRPLIRGFNENKLYHRLYLYNLHISYVVRN